MTLILTALCKEGICVCADKRRKRTYSDGTIKYEDNLYKIHKFKNIPILIFNHGINVINGKPWGLYCRDYEQSMRRGEFEFIKIANDFKRFIESDVREELRKNQIDNSIGFVICGRGYDTDDYQIKEFYWSPALKETDCKGLVRTGDGSKYLDRLFQERPKLNTVEYWKSKTSDEAQEDLANLFKKAVVGKKAMRGEEFSDEYDIEIIK